MNEVHFKKRRVEKLLYSRLNAASEELSRNSDRSYNLAKALFGRVIVAMIEGLVLAVVSSTSRPTRIRIVGVDADGVTYLPGAREGDTEKMVEKFSLSSEAVQRVNALSSGDDDELR